VRLPDHPFRSGSGRGTLHHWRNGAQFGDTCQLPAGDGRAHGRPAVRPSPHCPRAAPLPDYPAAAETAESCLIRPRRGRTFARDLRVVFR
jgi:hypothetical protein